MKNHYNVQFSISMRFSIFSDHDLFVCVHGMNNIFFESMIYPHLQIYKICYKFSNNNFFYCNYTKIYIYNSNFNNYGKIVYLIKPKKKKKLKVSGITSEMIE